MKTTPYFEWTLRSIVEEARPQETILLEYPVRSRPRYGHGKPPHPKLYEVINPNRQI